MVALIADYYYDKAPFGEECYVANSVVLIDGSPEASRGSNASINDAGVSLRADVSKRVRYYYVGLRFVRYGLAIFPVALTN